MNTQSAWKSTTEGKQFPVLSGNLQADAGIIGGGITGITAARYLSQAGKSVVVLEAGKIGQGSTGDSTGNLYASVDSFLYSIVDKWRVDTAKASGTKSFCPVSAKEW